MAGAFTLGCKGGGCEIRIPDEVPEPEISEEPEYIAEFVDGTNELIFPEEISQRMAKALAEQIDRDLVKFMRNEGR